MSDSTGGSADGESRTILGFESGELKRRMVHATGSIVPLGYAAGILSWDHVVALLVAGAFVAGVLEFLRLFVGLDWKIYDQLTREYEQSNPAGYALYMVSMAGVALLFRPAVAVPGMLMLTIGDPISGLLGSVDVSQVKKTRTLAVMFGVCFALAAPFLTGDGAGTTLVGGLAASGVGAAGATLADGVKPVLAGYVVDDNLSIPPAACLGIEATLLLVG